MNTKTNDLKNLKLKMKEKSIYNN